MNDSSCPTELSPLESSPGMLDVSDGDKLSLNSNSVKEQVPDQETCLGCVKRSENLKIRMMKWL